jgi:YggT family protein
MIYFLIALNILIQFYAILVIGSAILSYILPPFNRIRQTIDQLVNPLLEPIRRLLPNVGMFDFSPLVLLIVLQLLGNVVTSLINSMR